MLFEKIPAQELGNRIRRPYAVPPGFQIGARYVSIGEESVDELIAVGHLRQGEFDATGGG